MKPGEYILRDEPIVCNEGVATRILNVVNRGDRPVQIGSHYHFAEVNPALEFDRLAARGMRLDSPAGTAVRFEPGDARSVHLVELGGLREVYGFRDEVNGALGGSVAMASTEAIGGTAGIDPERDPETAEKYAIGLPNQGAGEVGGLHTSFGSDPADEAVYPPRPDRPAPKNKGGRTPAQDAKGKEEQR